MHILQKKYLLFSFIILISLCNCGGGNESSTSTNTPLPDNTEKVTITQGVWGNVWFWEGNFMPGTVGDPPSGGTISAVVRDVYIYQATTLQDVVLSSSEYSGFWCTSINKELVAVVKSDSTGFYEADLPVGTYSVFIKENEEFYADRYDIHNIINSVTIEGNNATKLQIDITYLAAF